MDLLISDLSMPGMDGLELIRQARGRRPRLPTVLITDYPFEAAAPGDTGLRSAPFQLMHKPVSGAYLVERVAAMLEAQVGRVGSTTDK